MLTIGCLNHHCLSTLIESLSQDAHIREGVYFNKAPMRDASVRGRLAAQAAALNGVKFDLKHWSSLLLMEGEEGSATAAGGAANSNSSKGE